MRCNPQNQMLKIFYIGKTFSKISVGVIQSLEQDISRIVIFIKKAQKLIQTFISTRFKPRSSLSLRCTAKKMFLKVLRNSQENTCVRVSFLITRIFAKNEILAQVFSCEFCKIFKNTFFYRTPPVVAFANPRFSPDKHQSSCNLDKSSALFKIKPIFLDEEST